MKVKKSTIVFFALAAFFFIGIFFYTESESPDWSDATYVKDAKVNPENEGKLIAISGKVKVMENAKDEVVGVSFNSPKVRRSVDEVIWDTGTQKWRLKQVNKGKSDDGYETDIIAGRISIGEFELDKKVTARVNFLESDVEPGDFSDKDIAHMDSEGYLIRHDTKAWYSTGGLVTVDMENIGEAAYLLHPSWDGSYIVGWKMWEPKGDEEFTVVGVQNGSNLTYTTLNAAVSADKFMDEEAFNERAEGYNQIDTKYIAAAFAVIFALLGVRSLFKNRKRNKRIN